VAPGRPPRVRRLAFGLILGLVLGVAPAQLASAEVTALDLEYLEMVNSTREARGAHPLHIGPRLSRLARQHSRSMARTGHLYHSNLSKVLSYALNVAGENVGVGASVQQVHQTFLNSPPHRDNLLAGRWKVTGIGVYEQGARVWITQIFSG
jgi:uncharacterized protein YkwD